MLIALPPPNSLPSMDRAEEARLDRIIHALKLVVSRKTAEKAAHEVAQIAEAVEAAESERGVQDAETRDALVTSDELAQRLEKDPNKRAALLERLKRVQQALTRGGGGGPGANLDLAAARRYGFDDYLTDTVSRRFRVGEAVLVSFDGKKAAALGKPKLRAPSCSPPFPLSHSLTHWPYATQASSALSPRVPDTGGTNAGSSTPSRPSAKAASARLSWSTWASPPVGWRRPSGGPLTPRR